jgi:predicted N-acetyltransferase YhbS
MELMIRLEEKKEQREVENLTREAFWDLYKPGCDEHLLVHKLRKSQVFIPELNIVALYQKRLVGHIIYAMSKILTEDMKEFETITFGPVSVLPKYQQKGIGSALIRHTMALAAKKGYKAVVIYGNPRYYHRFGFQNAASFAVTTSEGKNFDAFMICELSKNSLHGISGKFYDDPLYMIAPEELELFDRNFPYKEKHITPTQFR